MAPKYPYLTRSGPRGLLKYRRAVPPRLRSEIGKREIVKAFGTADLDAARLDYHVFAAEVEEELAAADEQVSWREEEAAILADGGHTDVMDWFLREFSQPADEVATCAKHVAGCREAERQFRITTTARVTKEPNAFWRGEIIDLPMTPDEFYALPQFSHLRPRGGSGHLLAMAYRTRLERRELALRGMLATFDFRALIELYGCCSDKCAQTFGAALARAELGFIAEILADDGALLAEPAATSESPQSSDASPQAQPKSRMQTANTSSRSPVQSLLSSAVAAWIEANSHSRSGWTEERRDLCKVVMDDFVRVCGDRGVGDYTKSDGREYERILSLLPANLDKMLRRLGGDRNDLADLAARARKLGLEPQSAVTINKKIAIANHCFDWIASRYDECQGSPLTGIKVKHRSSPKDHKQAFSTDQLSSIFRAPVYTGCASEVHWNRPGNTILSSSSKFWVPLIALFTGMRSGEICQLSRENIGEHRGCHYIALTRDLRLKNEPSIRSVPLHSTLIKIGFLEFVANCSERLFPDLPTHKTGRMSDAFGKHFARFLESLCVKEKGIDFHSFRHTFVAACEASGIEFSARERIVGHALPGQAARYGKKYDVEQKDMELMMQRARELEKLVYTGLNLDHLSEATCSQI